MAKSSLYSETAVEGLYSQLEADREKMDIFEVERDYSGHIVKMTYCYDVDKHKITIVKLYTGNDYWCAGDKKAYTQRSYNKPNNEDLRNLYFEAKLKKDKSLQKFLQNKEIENVKSLFSGGFISMMELNRQILNVEYKTFHYWDLSENEQIEYGLDL